MSAFTGRRDRIAGMLTMHAAEGGDVGDLLAAACRAAAARLDGTTPEGFDAPRRGNEALVAGRPGSWEAEHIRALVAGWEHEP